MHPQHLGELPSDDPARQGWTPLQPLARQMSARARLLIVVGVPLLGLTVALAILLVAQ